MLTACSTGLSADDSPIELVRDQWGVPHIFASSDAGALYGLGYATAEDRGFQMYYNLRIVQGRVAELIGDVQKIRRKETALQADRKMRMFGFYGAAKRVAGNLDQQTRDLLEAYCDGVNAYFEKHRGDWHYLFNNLGLEPEPWTPADCIASWWHIAQFFGPDGTRDLVASRSERPRLTTQQGRIAGPAVRPRGDEAAAVVGREDVTDRWIQRVDQFLSDHGVAEQQAGAGARGPKFSHAWVVGGKKTTTGSSVLVSDPQTMVGNPSLFYEFHLGGKTFNARGIGVPGSPIILIGFNDKVAWGMTALGADQADLFRLRTDADHPDQYYFDGQWRHMAITSETIKVKGGPSQTVKVRWTHFGPVITQQVSARPADGQFAVKRVPICETDRDTVQAAMAMMRASDVHQFARALAGWRFPSANVVFGDTNGNIGYWVVGALPLRATRAAQAGRVPHDGTESKYDWRGMVPHDLKPHLINPKRGYVFTANHRPIGSFYRIYIGASTGSMGETLRSWRLRELLTGKDRFTPEEVLAVHYDSVNPARRDLVRIGYHLRDVLKRQLSPKAAGALEYLEGWFQAGCPSDLTVRGAELAGQIDTLFRITRTELAQRHGGGQSGLALFFKHVRKRLTQDPKAEIRPLERNFVTGALTGAWDEAVSKYGPDREKWQDHAREAVKQRKLGYYQSLDGFPSLDTAQDLSVPALTCIDGATIRSQGGQAYTQFVPLNHVDRAKSLLPIGASERPCSPLRTTTLKLWETGKLHAAPISRQPVLAYAVSRKILRR